jgi:hypothetical protein
LIIIRRFNSFAPIKATFVSLRSPLIYPSDPAGVGTFLRRTPRDIALSRTSATERPLH